MRLCEVEAKALLAHAGIALPQHRFIDVGAAADLAGWSGGVAKAQLLSGGRGKAGLVRFADGADTLREEVQALRMRIATLGKPAGILVEERLQIEAEYYLSFLIDDVAQSPRLLFSTQGGIEVEEAGQLMSSMLIDPLRPLRPQQLLTFFESAGVRGKALGALMRLAAAVYKVFVAEDAELIEINPLAWSRDGKLVPLDCKMVLDDSAAFRHRGRQTPLSARLEDAELTPLEREAATAGFTFVEMPGEVAVMSAGAGMGMMLIDLIGQSGLRPACFVDGAVGSKGDQTTERLRLVFKRAQASDVRAIMFYQTLGTRDLKPRVEALLQLLRDTPPGKPFYFGLSATYLAERNMTAREACALVRQLGFFATSEANELVDRIRADLNRP